MYRSGECFLHISLFIPYPWKPSYPSLGVRVCGGFRILYPYPYPYIPLAHTVKAHCPERLYFLFLPPSSLFFHLL